MRFFNFKSLFLFVIVFLSVGIFYLIPNFEFNIADRWLVYKTLPNFNNKNDNLIFKNIILTPTYEYLITAESTSDNFKENTFLALQDSETLRGRLKVLYGDNFEIRTDFSSNSITHTIYLNESIDEYLNIITTSYNEFNIFEKSLNTSLNSINDQELQNNITESSNESENEVKLELTRSDFGFAEIREIKTDENKTLYQVRLPLSLFISYDRLKYLNNYLGKNLNIRIGGMEFQLYLDYNQNYNPVGLVIYGIENRGQALMLKSLLNSGSTNMIYKLSGVRFHDRGLNFFVLSYLFIPFIFLVTTFFLIRKNILEFNIIFKIGFFVILFLIIFKFLNIIFSLHTLFLLFSALFLSLFGKKYAITLYVFFISLISLKLLTILKGFDISLLSMFLSTSLVLLLNLILLKNYVKS